MCFFSNAAGILNVHVVQRNQLVDKIVDGFLVVSRRFTDHDRADALFTSTSHELKNGVDHGSEGGWLPRRHERKPAYGDK
jgi:hypothetical protein